MSVREMPKEGDSEDWLNDPKIQKFSVKDPVKVSGHVKYTCTGVDS